MKAELTLKDQVQCSIRAIYEAEENISYNKALDKIYSEFSYDHSMRYTDNMEYPDGWIGPTVEIWTQDETQYVKVGVGKDNRIYIMED